MPKRILVAGGAGYVGSVLVRALLQRGYAVRVLDQLYYGDRGVRDILQEIEFVQQDMRTVPLSIMEGVDSIINVGGFSNDPMADYDPQANYEMNVLAALHLANLCKQQGVQRYLFASSCSIYDAIHSAQAIDEQASLDETSPVDPPSIYARSKLEAEQRLLELVDQQFCPVILRKGTIYGYSPRMRYDLVLNAFVKNALKTSKIQLYNTGNVWRPLLGLEDAVQAYLLCLEAPLDVVRGEIFNVASEHYRIIDLAKLIQSSLSALGIEAEITRIDCLSRERSYRVSTEKLQRRLGFKSQASVAATLPTLYAHIRASNVRELDHPIYYNILWMRHLRESLEFQV